MTTALATRVQLEEKVLGLEIYDNYLRAIAKCHRVDEVKDLRDKLRALEVYAKQACNMEAEYRAAEIRKRAERRAGELLIEMAKSGQRAKAGSKGPSVGRGARPSVAIPRLADHGISKDQSSNWQKLAKVPEKKFEQLVQEPGISTEEIIRRAAPPDIQVTPRRDDGAVFDERALFVWGTLTDFEEKKWGGKSMLDLDPKFVAGKMTEGNKRDSVRLAPKVARWLEKLATEAKDGKE